MSLESRRRAQLAALGAVVLALHLAAPRPARDADAPAPPAPLMLASTVEVRSLLAPAAQAEAAAAPMPAPQPAPRPRRAAPRPPAPPTPDAPDALAATPAGAIAVPGTAVDTPAEAAAAPSRVDPGEAWVVAAAGAEREASPAAAGVEAPVYATRLPPPFRWQFGLKRGIVSGKGVLDWQRDGAGYRLSLEGTVGGLPLLEWVSQGLVDAHGVAPERFVVRQVGRAARAANFQRSAGKISYSSSDAEHPLLPGAQDRLSWVVQIAGVVAAAPQRFAAPGAQIHFAVSGVRGDVGLWTFESHGMQRVDTPSGRVDAVELRREAKRPFDTRGEVWLDPQRHHLPVKLVLSTLGRNGEVTDALTLLFENTAGR